MDSHPIKHAPNKDDRTPEGMLLTMSLFFVELCCDHVIQETAL